ncbi:16107_t:CDS:2 [Cetraspora pellucida]|uniref:16107_t:CDS:1 n=1 Tax=Cetraspora pellucida TaxID=1433469 RepID=A0A9N9AHZ4_9GLOM|nr:16107_t:CDS:2 [Cetraspora pellucida]
MHEEKDKTEANIVIYNNCSQKYSINTSMEILAEHLNKIHNYDITLKQRRYSVQKPYSKDDTVYIEEHESSVLDFFIGNQISFNIVEKEQETEQLLEKELDLHLSLPICIDKMQEFNTIDKIQEINNDIEEAYHISNNIIQEIYNNLALLLYDSEIEECSKNILGLEIIEIINSYNDSSKNLYYTLQKKKKMTSTI